MLVTIANISTSVGQPDLQTAVAAIGQQVTEHFQPEWGISGQLLASAISLSNGVADVDDSTGAIIYLGDSSQDPTTGIIGALGYHSVNYSNLPYGFVYLDVCAAYNEAWSVTLSHEVMELLGDPDAKLTVGGPAPVGSSGNVYYDLEVADATQGDTYTIGTVAVSNFVGRSYFDMTGGSGRTNYLGLPLVAFGVRPGGYVQYEDDLGAHQIYGEKVTQRQIDAKASMKQGRRNARRAARIRGVAGMLVQKGNGHQERSVGADSSAGRSIVVSVTIMN